VSDDNFRKAQERAARVQARRTKEPLTIENCQFEFKCPKRWDALITDGALDSRFCDVCMRRVHLCVTDDELRGPRGGRGLRGDLSRAPDKHRRREAPATSKGNLGRPGSQLVLSA